MADGRHDFDFLAGRWRVANRTLADPAPEAEPQWREFETTAESRPILAGLGNVDTYHAADFPGRGEYWGFALRLFEPATGLWRIWWASNPGTGNLEPPVVGRFSQGEGLFEGDDAYDGRAIRVRFIWSEISASSALWEQSFSFDGGGSFELNWIMRFRREPAASTS